MPSAPPSHTCPECGKSYKAKETLTRHRKNHDTSAQYVCHLCSGAFRRKDLLSRHVASHTSKANGHVRARRPNKSACERCSQRKLRCDGLEPCTKCAYTSAQCLYTVDSSARLVPVVDDLHADGFTTQDSGDISGGLDGLGFSVPAPAGGDTAASWPWAYEQMYMHNNRLWPDVSDDPQAVSVPSTLSEGAREHAASASKCQETRSFTDGSVIGSAVFESWNTSANALSNLDGNSTREFGSNDKPVSEVEREEIVKHAVDTSLAYARNPQYGIWDAQAVSSKICDAFAVSVPHVQPHALFQHLVALYFDNFYLQCPILHRQSLRSLDRDCPYLLLTLSAIGAAFAGQSAWALHITLLNTLREYLPAACFSSDGVPEHQLEFLAASLLLMRVSYMYFGHSRALSSTQMIGGALMYLVRRLDILGSATLSGQLSPVSDAPTNSRIWLQHENRKHLAVGMLMLENDVSILFGSRPLISADEFGIGLPCSPQEWVAVGDSDETSTLINHVSEPKPREQPMMFSQLIRVVTTLGASLPTLDLFQAHMVMQGLQERVWRHSYEHIISNNDVAQDSSVLMHNTVSRLHGTNFGLDASMLGQTSSDPTVRRDSDSRQHLVETIHRIKQSLLSTAATSVLERSDLLSARLLIHLSFVKMEVPIAAIHRLFLDTSQNSINDFTFQLVLGWAVSSHAIEGALHALAIRDLLHTEVLRPSRLPRAKLNILAQFGLFHGAAVLWALAGARGDTGPAVYDAFSRKNICVQQSTIAELLHSFVGLLHMIGLEWNGMSSLKAAVRDMAQIAFPKKDCCGMIPESAANAVG